MAFFDDLKYCKSSKRWVGGPKSQNHDDIILEWSLIRMKRISCNDEKNGRKTKLYIAYLADNRSQ